MAGFAVLQDTEETASILSGQILSLIDWFLIASRKSVEFLSALGSDVAARMYAIAIAIAHEETSLRRVTAGKLSVF